MFWFRRDVINKCIFLIAQKLLDCIIGIIGIGTWGTLSIMACVICWFCFGYFWVPKVIGCWMLVVHDLREARKSSTLTPISTPAALRLDSLSLKAYRCPQKPESIRKMNGLNSKALSVHIHSYSYVFCILPVTRNRSRCQYKSCGILTTARTRLHSANHMHKPACDKP